MNVSHYQHKVLSALSKAGENGLSRYNLKRGTMAHIKTAMVDMLLDTMKTQELLECHVKRRMKGAGKPSRVYNITQIGKEFLAKLPEENDV